LTRNDLRIAVIGAGLGGLSAAMRLADKGNTVDVYDKRSEVGGKAAQFRSKGDRFDMGPSLLTLPDVFRELFTSVGENIDHHLKFIDLDPITRYFFPDGTVLNAFSDKERFCDEVEEKLGDSSQTVKKYLDRCRRTYEASTPVFMFKPLHEASTLASTDTIEAFFKTPIIDAFKTMHQVNSKWFRDKRTIQLFDRYATYNGSSPFMTPGTFNLIQHVEYGIGGFAVEGGIHRIPLKMKEIAKKKGASFNSGKTVDRILVENSKVKGIEVSGEKMDYDIVVSNSDVTSTYNDLLDDRSSRSAKKFTRLEPSSSGQVFLWGVGRENRRMLDNNIFFSIDYKKEFNDIWNKRISPEDPTVYINITSKSDPDDSPEGKENWFVLINVPYDSGQDWVKEKEKTRDRTLMRFSEEVPDLKDLIEVEETIGPEEIVDRYGGNRGSIYGISSNNRASAFLRQSNRSKEYKGLYFAGGSAHPGGDMTLVVLTGKHAADLIITRTK
jgi:phytoene desaturase